MGVSPDLLDAQAGKTTKGIHDMKQVDHLAILGNPERIDRQVACPHCHDRAVAFEDGSIHCVLENKSFAPEVTDGELYLMRQQFDRRLGIDPSVRLLLPANVRNQVNEALARRNRQTRL